VKWQPRQNVACRQAGAVVCGAVVAGRQAWRGPVQNPAVTCSLGGSATAAGGVRGTGRWRGRQASRQAAAGRCGVWWHEGRQAGAAGRQRA